MPRQAALPAEVVDAAHGTIARQRQHQDVRHARRRVEQQAVIGCVERAGPGQRAASRIAVPLAPSPRRTATSRDRWSAPLVAGIKPPQFVPAVEQHELADRHSGPSADRWFADAPSANACSDAVAQQFVRPAQDGLVQIVAAHRISALPPCSRAAWRTCRYSWPRRIIATKSAGCASCTQCQSFSTATRSATQRFLAVIVEALDFVVQVWIFRGDACGDVELRIERRARHACQARRRFTAFGQRRKEGDVQRMRKARARRRSGDRARRDPSRRGRPSWSRRGLRASSSAEALPRSMKIT